MFTLEAPAAAPLAQLSFSSDGALLAAAAPLGGLWVWSLPERELIDSLERDGVHWLTFVPGTRRLVFGGEERALIWAPVTGSSLRTLEVPKDSWCPLNLSYHVDETALTVAYTNRVRSGAVELRRWELPSGKLRRAAVEYVRCRVCGLALPDGEGPMAVWDGGEGVTLWPLSGLWWHPGIEPITLTLAERPWIERLQWAPGGSSLALSGATGVRLLDPVTRQTRTLTQLPGDIRDVVYSPDGRSLACGIGSGRVLLHDVGTGRTKGEFCWDVGVVESVEFAPDGMTMAAGGDGKVVVWDVPELAGP